jgi:hypothetical protein
MARASCTIASAALDVLERARRLGEGSEFLFPDTLQCHPLSNMAMLKMLERMGHSARLPEQLPRLGG